MTTKVRKSIGGVLAAATLITGVASASGKAEACISIMTPQQEAVEAAKMAFVEKYNEWAKANGKKEIGVLRFRSVKPCAPKPILPDDMTPEAKAEFEALGDMAK